MANGTTTPQQSVNSVTGVFNSLLGGLIDGATGALSRVGAIELERYELKRLADLRASEAAMANQRQSELAGTYTTREKMIIGASSAVAVVMLAAAAFLISRR